jgi:hypothetical protein
MAEAYLSTLTVQTAAGELVAWKINNTYNNIFK